MSDEHIKNNLNTENTEASEIASSIAFEAASNVASDSLSSNVASEVLSEASYASVSNVASVNVTAKKMIWKKEDLCLQIRSFEHQLSLIEKREIENTNNIKDIKESIVKLIVNFEKNELCLVEQNIFDTKEKIYQTINQMTRWQKTRYFSSLWGITPIGIAILAMIISFSQIKSNGSDVILGVPLWASFIAVAGTSVQILIGVANDYKEDCMITEYKRMWYIVLPFVSFVFGFIAYLLTSAGLISIVSGQIMYDQSANFSAVSEGVSSSITNPPAIYVIICFMAGYATDWFMGLLLKYTSEK